MRIVSVNDQFWQDQVGFTETFNPFLDNFSILYLLKTPENQRFYHVLKEYEMEALARNNGFKSWVERPMKEKVSLWQHFFTTQDSKEQETPLTFDIRAQKPTLHRFFFSEQKISHHYSTLFTILVFHSF